MNPFNHPLKNLSNIKVSVEFAKTSLDINSINPFYVLFLLPSAPPFFSLSLSFLHTRWYISNYMYICVLQSQFCMGLIHHERGPIDKWKKDGEKNTFLRTKAIEMKTKQQIQLVVSHWMCHWINAQMLNTFDSTQRFYKRLTLIATNSRIGDAYVVQIYTGNIDVPAIRSIQSISVVRVQEDECSLVNGILFIRWTKRKT